MKLRIPKKGLCFNSITRVAAPGQYFALSPVTYIVKITSYDMDVACQRLQVIVRFPRAQVSGAKYVLDASGNQELLELGRQAAAPVWNVQVAQD